MESAAEAVKFSTSEDDGNTLDMNETQTKGTLEDDMSKPEAHQKDASEAKPSPAKYYTDIYHRVPGKEPKYPIPCPNCKRELAVSRFCHHLEKCMGLGGRGVSSSHHSSSSGSQAKRRKSSI